MSIFHDRERAFERAYVNREEARFRALALRNRMLGEWAAERLRLRGEAYVTYVNMVSSNTGSEPIDENLLETVSLDFHSHGIAHAEELVRDAMTTLLVEALQRLRATKT